MHDLLYHDSLYCDSVSGPNKLFDLMTTLTFILRRFALLDVLFKISQLCFECLREGIASTLTQTLPHWQVISTLKYVLHLNFLDLVRNKSYNNPFFRTLLKNIGPWSERSALASSGRY